MSFEPVNGRTRGVGLISLLAALMTSACVAADAPRQAASAAPTAADATVDLRRGRIMFLQCRACHSTEADGEHKVGPNLHGLFGASAGEKDGFTYSSAMSEADTVWSEDTLDAFLERPTDYVPGTIMVFAGIEEQADRQALIAYLRSLVE